MKSYSEYTRQELLEEKHALQAEYEEYQEAGLALDMSRGKPETRQLDLAMELLNTLDADTDMMSGALDTRNYGGLEGIKEAKALFADMLKTVPEKIVVCGSSSLNSMFDTISRSMTHGVCGSTPWCKLDRVRFLCPAPGYDRHFKVTEYFGIDLITVPMTPDGPDMDVVEKLVSADPLIKGIWCVPKYSNPEGVVYSDETVRRFANLKPAAEDFRIFWDNAYGVHHLYEPIEILNIIDECEKAGNPDLYYEFCSFSKVSFAGASVAAIAMSENNKKDCLSSMGIQTISNDKINQLRHARYFKNAEGIAAHMEKHAAILRPKFEMVDKILSDNLEGRGCGNWTKPKGGYFVTYYANTGCATRIVKLCSEAGVVMTGAGAPFPYGKDPKDSVIRIAPSYPPIDELEMAAKIFVTCVKLATVEQLLAR